MDVLSILFIDGYLFIWPHRVLATAHGIKPGPPALGVWSLNHWNPRKSWVCFLLLSSRCSVVSDSLQPHDLQCAKLPCPSLPPGVSWVCFLNAAKYLSQNSVGSVAQSCLTLCSPMIYSVPSFPVLLCLQEFHGCAFSMLLNICLKIQSVQLLSCV